jgi:hypothetical protein
MPYLSTAEKSLDSLMRRESRSRKSLYVYIVTIYCEKVYLPSTVEKLNCLLEKSLMPYLSTAEKSLDSLMRRESRSRTAASVSMSMSVNPSALSASGVFLSMDSRQSAASCGSSNSRACRQKTPSDYLKLWAINPRNMSIVF